MRFDVRRNDTSCNSHYQGVFEWARQAGKPLCFGERVVIQERYDLSTRSPGTAVARTTQSDRGLDYVSRSPSHRHLPGLVIAWRVVDHEDVEVGIV